VQINGKVRDRLEVAPDIDAADLEALARALPSVGKHIGASEIRTVVVRAPRLVNFVVR
jgi:leucyl-tRNA synthetase